MRTQWRGRMRFSVFLDMRNPAKDAKGGAKNHHEPMSATLRSFTSMAVAFVPMVIDRVGTIRSIKTISFGKPINTLRAHLVSLQPARDKVHHIDCEFWILIVDAHSICRGDRKQFTVGLATCRGRPPAFSREESDFTQ